MIGRGALRSATRLASRIESRRFELRAIWRDFWRATRTLWAEYSPLRRVELCMIVVWDTLGYLVRTLWIIGDIAVSWLWLQLRLIALRRGPAATPFGTDFAERVATALDSQPRVSDSACGAFLSEGHPHYCGIGLFAHWDHREGYFMAECTDGWPGDPLLFLADRRDFVAWLAQQSDLSLSGIVGPYRDWYRVGNQRLSRAALLKHMEKFAPTQEGSE